jgi:hypothetical protein
MPPGGRFAVVYIIQLLDFRFGEGGLILDLLVGK